MDTSETYIKMRLAAIPDLGMGIPIKCPCYCISQDVWVDSKGDWYYQTGTFNVKGENCQLERQDQLQEMVEYKVQYGDYTARFYLFVCMNNYLIPEDAILRKPACDYFTTWNQVWLAFIMKEKDGKYWNGNDWLKET